MTGNKFSSWKDMQNKFDPSTVEFFRYMQLRSLFQTFDLPAFGEQSGRNYI